MRNSGKQSILNRGQNFVFCFCPGRVWAEISISLTGRSFYFYFGPDRAGPGPTKSGPCRLLDQIVIIYGGGNSWKFHVILFTAIQSVVAVAREVVVFRLFVYKTTSSIPCSMIVLGSGLKKEGPFNKVVAECEKSLREVSKFFIMAFQGNGNFQRFHTLIHLFFVYNDFFEKCSESDILLVHGTSFVC